MIMIVGVVVFALVSALVLSYVLHKAAEIRDNLNTPSVIEGTRALDQEYERARRIQECLAKAHDEHAARERLNQALRQRERFSDRAIEQWDELRRISVREIEQSRKAPSERLSASERQSNSAPQLQSVENTHSDTSRAQAQAQSRIRPTNGSYEYYE